MKKYFMLLAAVILVSTLFIGGCPEPAPSGPEEILVGVCAPLTGVHAGFGEGNVWGEKAAVEDINNQGGIYVAEYGRKLPIKLLVVNNESDSAKAMSLTEDLVLRSKVHFLADPNQPVDLALAEATVAERYKVARISGGTPEEAWLALRAEASPPWEHSYTYTLAIAVPAPEGSIWDQPGYTCMDSWLGILSEYGDQLNGQIGVFASDEPDGRSWYAAIPPVLEQVGFNPVGVDEKLGLFPMDTTDFSSIVTEWMNNDVEAVWGNCPASPFGTMWRQAKAMGFQPKLVIATRASLYYEDISAWGGDLPLGISGEAWWSPAFDPEVCPGIGGTTPMSLYERWVEDTGRPLNPGIGWGYNGIQILADAIERAGSLDSEEVCQALSETDMPTISSPRVMFDENHSARLPVFFNQWQKTDKPWVWESKVVLSYFDFLPEEAELLFPIPYD
jgi:branched-chain amino acid transport system substrate-binding protein